MINSVKLKALLYIGLAFVSCLVAFIVCFFGIGLGWLYSCSWGLFFGATGAVLARTIFHLYLEDFKAEMWQVSIYGLIACLGWLGCILCASYTWLFVWIALIVGMGLMLVGVRFIDGYIANRENAPKDTDSILASLINTRRYRFIEDDPSKGENLEKPVCLVDNKALTVAEAEAEGYVKVARKGKSYLKKICKKMK